MKNTMFEAFKTYSLFDKWFNLNYIYLAPKMTLGGPPPPDFMPLSAPCEGIPVTFHDNVRHDLSNNTKWTGEMYVMTGIGQATNGTLVLD